MTYQDMAKYVGRRGTIAGSGSLEFEVEVTDVKQQWGITRFQVKPVSGFGRSWVENVKFTPIQTITVREILDRR